LIISGAGAVTGLLLQDSINGYTTIGVSQAILVDYTQFDETDVVGDADEVLVSVSDDGSQWRVHLEANNGDLITIYLPIANEATQNIVAELHLAGSIPADSGSYSIGASPIYYWSDKTHDGEYTGGTWGEAVIDQRATTDKLKLERGDLVKSTGTSDFDNFTANHWFFDGSVDYGSYGFGGMYPGSYNDGMFSDYDGETPEAIMLDDGDGIWNPGVLNGVGSPDQIITTGKAALAQELGPYTWSVTTPYIRTGTDKLFYYDDDGGGWNAGNDIFFNYDGDAFYTATADVLIDNDGTTIGGVGGSTAAMVSGQQLLPFDTADNLYWYDQGTAKSVDAGDSLWIESSGDSDNVYNAHGQLISGAAGGATFTDLTSPMVFDAQIDIAFNGGGYTTYTLENSGPITAETLSTIGLESDPAPVAAGSPVKVTVGLNDHYYIVNTVTAVGQRTTTVLIGDQALTGDQTAGTTFYEQQINGASEVAGTSTNYWWADNNHNGVYDAGEAIVGGYDNILDNADPIPTAGTADLNVFGTYDYFWDFNNDGDYDDGEAIFRSTNSDTFLDAGLLSSTPDQLITSGTVPLGEDTATTTGNIVYFNSAVAGWQVNEDIFQNLDGDAYYTTAADVAIDCDGVATSGVGACAAITAGDVLDAFEAADAIYWYDNAGGGAYDGTNDALWYSGAAVPDGLYATTGASISDTSAVTTLATVLNPQFDISVDGGGASTITLENSLSVTAETISRVGVETADVAANPSDLLYSQDTSDYYIATAEAGSGQMMYVDIIGNDAISGSTLAGDHLQTTSIFGSSDTGANIQNTVAVPASGIVTIDLTAGHGITQLPGNAVFYTKSGGVDTNERFINLDTINAGDTSIRVAAYPGTSIDAGDDFWWIGALNLHDGYEVDDAYLDSSTDIVNEIVAKTSGITGAYGPAGFATRYKFDSTSTAGTSAVAFTDSSGSGTNVADDLKLRAGDGGSQHFGGDQLLRGSPTEDVTTGATNVVTGAGYPFAFDDTNTDNAFDLGEDIYEEQTHSSLTYTGGADLLAYVGTAQDVAAGNAVTAFVDGDDVMYVDGNHDGGYDAGEALVVTAADVNPGDDLPSTATILARNDAAAWSVGAQDLITFTSLGNHYFTDADNGGTYTDGEAIVGSADTTLSSADTVITAGAADLDGDQTISATTGILTMEVDDGSGGTVDLSGVSAGDLLLIDDDGNVGTGTPAYVVALDDGGNPASTLRVAGLKGDIIPVDYKLYTGAISNTGNNMDVDDHYMDSGDDIAASLDHALDTALGAGNWADYVNAGVYNGNYSSRYKLDSALTTTTSSAVAVQSIVGPAGTDVGDDLELRPADGAVATGPDQYFANAAPALAAPTDDTTTGSEVITSKNYPLSYNDADPDGTTYDSIYQDGQDIYQEETGGAGTYTDGADVPELLVYIGTDGTDVSGGSPGVKGSAASHFVAGDNIWFRNIDHDSPADYDVGEPLLISTDSDLGPTDELLARADAANWPVLGFATMDSYRLETDYDGSKPAEAAGNHHYYYVDDNNDQQYTDGEAIIDQIGGSDLNRLELASLAPATDYVIHHGLANLLPFPLVQTGGGDGSWTYKFLVPSVANIGTPLEIEIRLAFEDAAPTGFYVIEGTIVPVNV